MYRFCKIFGATPAEYESRSHEEVTKLLAIDDVYNEVKAERNA